MDFFGGISEISETSEMKGMESDLFALPIANYMSERYE